MSIKLESELKKLSTPSIIMVEIGENNHENVSLKIIKELSKKNRGIYLTMNKPMEKLNALFKSNKINSENISFVDSVSLLNSAEIKNTAQCSYIDNPSNITEMNIQLLNEMEKNKNTFLVVDSVPMLLLYNSEESVMRFLHFLSGVNVKLNTNIVLLTSKKSETERFRDTVSQFCDKIISV